MTVFGRLLLVCLAVFGLTSSDRADAHALDPGYLEVTALAGETYRIVWRRPDVRGQIMPLVLSLPDGCDITTPPAPGFDGRAWVSRWVTNCTGGLRGASISVDGLDERQTDVLVRLDLGDSGLITQRQTSQAPVLSVPVDPGGLSVLGTYLPLGVEHILGGIDHLLFVLALLLLIPDRRRLLWTITAFTAAHSLTMAAATLGLVMLPGPPVEAVIALSIMFVASELVRRDGHADRLSERAPWLVAFAFGLLHGFGFAGALQEIGLPQTDVPLALIAFNVGVEIGQLAFVAAVLSAIWLARRIVPAVTRVLTPGTGSSIALAYAIGGISAYWVIDRLSGF